MIIVMKADIRADTPEVRSVVKAISEYPDVRTDVREIQGASRALTEIYVIGTTGTLPTERFSGFACVEKVVRISAKYRHIGRHEGADPVGFEYRGLRFDQDSFHLFAGLCAVDRRENAASMFAALREVGITTTRAGAYKPRTSPYDFQGKGAECLPWLFELAGEFGMQVISMEITHESQVDEILEALQKTGNPTGVMLQIGTRNAQNFELLKRVGSQTELPILFKRGMGITLEESLNACEYLASAGNTRLVFCLRGMKTNFGDPHRNFVDFAHVPVVKRKTRLPVCIDPSHSVGSRARAPDGLLDVQHVTAQGIIAGANMVLVDFHPRPGEALCDGPQALLVEELSGFKRDCEIVREAYLQRLRAVH